MYKAIIALVLCLSLVVVPVVQRSTVEAVAISSSVAGLILLILLALGFTFSVSNSDISQWLDTQINAFLTHKGYSSTDEWLGDGWASSISSSGAFVGVPYSVWKKVNEMADYTVQQGELPAGGSVSSPVSVDLVPSSYLSNVSMGSVSYPTYPIYYGKDIYHFDTNTYVYKVDSLPDVLLSVPYSVISSQSLGSSISFDINSVIYTYPINYSFNNFFITFGKNAQSRIVLPSVGGTYAIDTSKPVEFVLLGVGSRRNYRAEFLPLYTCVGGFRCICYYSPYQQGAFSTVQNSSSISVQGTGVTPYPDITEDGGMIYIDGQLGDQTSGNAALINLLNAVNQNLVRATVALQELNAGNLPVDTSPFIQLVESYENITNDIISGSVSISSGVSSMYTLLSNSLSSITNPALSDACINAYNAFLNKVQLFRDGGGSSSSGNMQSVQDFQDYLSGLTGSFSSRAANATSQLDVYIGQASGLIEINALYSAYSAYMESLGFEIDLVTDIQSDISSINTAVDNYVSGDITRDDALTNIRTAFKSGIRHAKTGDQLGAVSSAYSAALDQLAVRELDLEVAAGNTIGDTLALEADLAGQFQLSEYEAYLQFNSWRFVDHTEGPLYREYFERFLDEGSPFYVFLYLPLALGLTGILLGSAIQFGVKSKHGSHNNKPVR